MVLDEALRLYPPSVLPRQANAADQISGYGVPQDAVVVISQYIIHRHPDWWSAPEQFQPERFTPVQAARRHRFAYIPFGEGPRMCIGQAFALMEMHPSWRLWPKPTPCRWCLTALSCPNWRRHFAPAMVYG